MGGSRLCPLCRGMGNDILSVIKNRSILDKTTGCINWTSYLSKDGYAVIKFKKQRHRVARVVLEHKIGRELIEGKETCHKCNNRKCVNPDHLYEGTHKENGEDLAEAGSVKGEKCGTSKITEHIARAIKDLLSEGISCRSISESLGIPETIVGNIKYKNYWYWV